MALWSEVILSAYRWAKPPPVNKVKGINLRNEDICQYLDREPCKDHLDYFHPVKPDDICPVCQLSMEHHRFISPRHLYIPFKLNTKVKLNTICRVCPGDYVVVVPGAITIVNPDLMHHYIMSIQKE